MLLDFIDAYLFFTLSAGALISNPQLRHFMPLWSSAAHRTSAADAFWRSCSSA